MRSAILAALATAASLAAPAAAGAQSRVLEGYYLPRDGWNPAGWGRGCEAKDANNVVHMMPNGTVMETQEVIVNPDGSRTTVTRRVRCVDGEWKPAVT